MKPILKAILVRFGREGIELSVSYEHADGQPTPGTKGRTKRAGRMARVGLAAALEGLDRGDALQWGGYGTNTRESTDTVLLAQEAQNKKGAA